MKKINIVAYDISSKYKLTFALNLTENNILEYSEALYSLLNLKK